MEPFHFMRCTGNVSKGDPIQRPYFLLAILILAALLSGCSPKATAQPEHVKALANPTPTSTPEKPTPIASATYQVLPHDPPTSCPITVPQNPLFVPPAPYDSLGFKDEFWYGSNS